ncbi:MAG: threonylcarbamoyl-AMP synthase [Gemmataceae bacterium]|nr:threonylcarbamoyl-AMP synthase [Gemmataceae bacterium]
MGATTPVLRIDPTAPEPGAVRRAADLIRAGRLVAFPTETVYGLGANALDPAAVAGIFAAKGRPATNPVIVHIAEVAQAAEVTAEWPGVAGKLAARFWPGPLTLVVPKRPEVPDVVTAGGPTVAVRCPAHPVAQALIQEAGVPVAAPSANRSTELSPTRAEHVLKGLGGRIDLILDGGPCPGGIESTVVDVTGGAVRLLRPGLVTVPMLEAVVGPVLASRGVAEGVARSPGQMERHYSPRTRVVLAEGQVQAGQLLGRFRGQGQQVRVLVQHTHLIDVWTPELVSMADDPEGYAAALYDTLHRLDGEGLDAIIVTMPGDEDEPDWAAVRDRLTRAAQPSG